MNEQKTDREFELVEDLGIVGRSKNGGYTKHLILARWGKHHPCYELRTFKDGEPLKRTGLTPEELSNLKDILSTMDI